MQISPAGQPPGIRLLPSRAAYLLTMAEK